MGDLPKARRCSSIIYQIVNCCSLPEGHDGVHKDASQAGWWRQGDKNTCEIPAEPEVVRAPPKAGPPRATPPAKSLKDRANEARRSVVALETQLSEAKRSVESFERACKHVWAAQPHSVRVVPDHEFVDSQGWRPRTAYIEEQRCTVYHRACELCGKWESTERSRSKTVIEHEANWNPVDD